MDNSRYSTIQSRIHTKTKRLTCCSQFCITIGYNVTGIHLSRAKDVFIIQTGYDLNLIVAIATTIRMDVCNKTSYTCIHIDVCDVFDIMTFVMNILIKITILTLFLNTLTIVFHRINLKLDKQSELKLNQSNIIIIVNKFCKIDVIAIILRFFVSDICFIMSALNGSLSNIALSIQFDALSNATSQILICLAIQISIDTITHHAQLIHNVCHVFYFFLHFCILFFEFVNVVLLINYSNENTCNIHNTIV